MTYKKQGKNLVVELREKYNLRGQQFDNIFSLFL